jgi:hypothetical protein
MDGFPFNLILTVATASATIFLGFLPTASIRSSFFARASLKAALAWGLVMLVTPPAIMHYPFFFALLCGGAWRQFSRDSAFNGKMWLCVASGLGISLGVMLLLALTPRAWPPGLPQVPQILLLASIYLGGAIIGLACVCASLAHNLSTASGVTYAVVQRYVGLLLNLILARAVVLPALLLLTPDLPGHVKVAEYELPMTKTSLGNGLTDLVFHHAQDVGVSIKTLLLLGLVVILIPGLAFLASRATRFSSKIKPTRLLIAICFFGLLAETLARLLVL